MINQTLPLLPFSAHPLMLISSQPSLLQKHSGVSSCCFFCVSRCDFFQQKHYKLMHNPIPAPLTVASDAADNLSPDFIDFSTSHLQFLKCYSNKTSALTQPKVNHSEVLSRANDEANNLIWTYEHLHGDYGALIQHIWANRMSHVPKRLRSSLSG